MLLGYKEPYACGYCGKVLSNKYNWRIHVRDKHEQSGVQLFCNLCNKGCKSQDALRKHMTTYHKG